MADILTRPAKRCKLTCHRNKNDTRPSQPVVLVEKAPPIGECFACSDAGILCESCLVVYFCPGHAFLNTSGPSICPTCTISSLRNQKINNTKSSVATERKSLEDSAWAPKERGHNTPPTEKGYKTPPTVKGYKTPPTKS